MNRYERKVPKRPYIDAVTFDLRKAEEFITRAVREMDRRGETKHVMELSEAAAVVAGALMDREGEE